MKAYKNKPIKLPGKAYEVMFIDSGFRELSYFPRPNSKDDNVERLILPQWLSKLMKSEVNSEIEKALKKYRQSLRDSMDFLKTL